MIIKLSILIILILGAFAFLGIKLSSSLKDLKFLFLVLYGVSIFTVCNIILSIYFFVSLRNKRGSPGPKGKTGPMGDKGIDGDCVEIDCLKKSLVAIIIDTLEAKLQDKYEPLNLEKIKKFKPLQGFEKNAICSYVNKISSIPSITPAILTSLTGNIDKYFTEETSDLYDRSETPSNFLIKTGTGILQSIHTNLGLTLTDVDFSKISFETCSN